MNEHLTDGHDLSLEEAPLSLPEAEPALIEPTPPKRTRSVAKTAQKITIRNLTRRAIVAKDSTGGGIHIVPGVDVEIAADLVSDDLTRKAKRGLIALN